MRLTRIVLNDWLGYEECDLDLSGFDQVVVVGEVGSGKSSLIDAVTWALWGEARGEVLDSVIRDGQNACTVRIDFTTGPHGVSITRTKTRGRDSTLSLEVDGNPHTQHTLRETLAQIGLLTGLSYDAALAGPLMLQESAALMRLRPSERKEVLLGLYGLERFTVWQESAKQKRDDATLTVRSHETWLTSMGDLDLALATVKEALTATGDQIETLTDHVIVGREQVHLLTEQTAGLKERASRGAELRQQLDEARAKFKSAKDAVREDEALLLTATAQLNSTIVADLDSDLPQKVTAAEELAREASKAHGQAFGAQTTADAQLAAMENREEVTCPECGAIFRPGVDETHMDAVRDHAKQARLVTEALVVERDKAEAEVKRLRAADQMALTLRSKRAEAEADVQRLEQRIAIERALLAEVAEQGKRLAYETNSLEMLEPALNDALIALDTEQRVLKSYEDDLRAAEADAVRQDVEVQRLKRDVARCQQIQAELATARGDAQTYGLLAKAFGRDGIPTLMLESGLPLIEQRANEVLSRMPGDFAVRLVIRRDGGRAQDRLDVVVEIGGSEREYAKLSGGQKFRVDLALRLGLTKALAGRTFESLIIDEGVDRHQDPAGREAIMESLASIAADFGLIVIVSHNAAVQDRFDTRIEVTMEDGLSHAAIA